MKVLGGRKQYGQKGGETGQKLIFTGRKGRVILYLRLIFSGTGG
jgi:hypothetical protein